MKKEKVVTAIALRIVVSVKRRLNKDTSFLFLTTVIDVSNKITIVTVLIPPAVPTGEPPININIIIKNIL